MKDPRDISFQVWCAVCVTPLEVVGDYRDAEVYPRILVRPCPRCGAPAAPTPPSPVSDPVSLN